MIVKAIMSFIVAVMAGFAALSSAMLPHVSGTSAEGSAASAFEVLTHEGATEDLRPLYIELPAEATPAIAVELTDIRVGTWVPQPRPTTMAITFGPFASSGEMANSELIREETRQHADLQQLSYKADCNGGVGAVWFEGATMHVGEMISTQKACPSWSTKRGIEMGELLFNAPTFYVVAGDTSVIYLKAGDKAAKFIRP